MNDREKLAHAGRTIGTECDLLLIDCNVGMVVAALLEAAVTVACRNGMTARKFVEMVELLLDETVDIEEEEEES